jgi:hypothetical protein
MLTLKKKEPLSGDILVNEVRSARCEVLNLLKPYSPYFLQLWNNVLFNEKITGNR